MGGCDDHGSTDDDDDCDDIDAEDEEDGLNDGEYDEDECEGDDTAENDVCNPLKHSQHPERLRDHGQCFMLW